MDGPKVVFVVGAGASVGFGLPVGETLLKRVSALTHFRFDDWGRPTQGDMQIWDALQKPDRNETRAYAEAAKKLSDTAELTLSVDDLLKSFDENQRLVEIGKLAVAKVILDAEREGSLGKISNGEGHDGLGQLSDSWIYQLFRHIRTTVHDNERAGIFSRFAVINFNYDRCIEQFLFIALQRAFHIDVSQAADALESLHIIHPYGSLGALDWSRAHGAIPYGAKSSQVKLPDVAKGLRTYTEQKKGGLEQDIISDVIKRCNMIVFLGFGFHPQNMAILQRPDTGSLERVFATTGTEPDGRVQVFADRIQNAIKPGPRKTSFHGNTCDDFMREWATAITAI